MFEVIRRKRRIAQGILLLLILPFAFFGIERYFSGGPSHQEAAKVGDAVVTTAELRQAVEERTAQLRQRFGENFDARIVRDPAFVERVLRELIERRLVQVEAARLGVVVTPEALQRAIASFEVFQQDGQFSYPRYEAVLRAQGLTPKAFEAMLAQDLAVQRLVEPIAQGAIVPREQTLQLVAQQLEEREVSVAVRAAADEADPAGLTEEALRAYYEANAARYVAPAKVRLQYLLVDEEEIGRGLTPSERICVHSTSRHRSSFAIRPASRCGPSRRCARRWPIPGACVRLGSATGKCAKNWATPCSRRSTGSTPWPSVLA